MNCKSLLLSLLFLNNLNAQELGTKKSDSIQKLEQVFISTKVIFGSKYEVENRSGSAY